MILFYIFDKLLAYSWIGGSVMLFGMGIYFKDKETIKIIYQYIGPFYGYFEMVVLVGLLSSGIYFFNVNNFSSILFDGSDLSFYIKGKIALAILIVIMTFIHLVISFSTIGKERNIRQKIISRIFIYDDIFLNLTMGLCSFEKWKDFLTFVVGIFHGLP